MGRHKLTDKRICFACGSSKTRIQKHGAVQWRRPIDWFVPLWFCDTCRARYFHGPEMHRKWDKIHHVRYGARAYKFGAKKTFIGWGLQRTGFCLKCSNNIHDGSCKRTHMHHVYYLRICPWFGREELCVRCHNAQRGVPPALKASLTSS